MQFTPFTQRRGSLSSSSTPDGVYARIGAPRRENFPTKKDYSVVSSAARPGRLRGISPTGGPNTNTTERCT